MGTQPNALELARQGNVKAIAALINRALKPCGITASVRLKHDCLHIILEAAQIPKQPALIRFVYNSMVKLKIASVRTVKVYGRQLGQDFPAWSNALALPPLNGTGSLTQTLDRQPDAIQTQSPPKQMTGQTHEQDYQRQPGLGAIAQSSAQIGAPVATPNFKRVRFPNSLGRVLIAALAIQISLDGLLALFSLVGYAVSAFYDSLNSWDTTGILTSLIDLIVESIDRLWDPLRFFDGGILWITMGVFLVWLFRLQISLKTALPQYPITPWGAIARFALPFYNFWGIWDLWATLANRLKSWRQTTRWGCALRRWLPWYYGVWLALWILQRTDWIFSRLDIASTLPAGFYLVLSVISLMLSLLMLKIVWIIHRATSRLTQSQPPT